MWDDTRGNVIGLAGTRILIGCTITLLGIWLPAARAGHPPTPPPCEAEGVCRPNRTTWGWSQTRWRPWPGDKAGLRPSATPSPTSEQAEEPFQPFERPTPEAEDLRRKPAKKAEVTEPEAPEPGAPEQEPKPKLPPADSEGRAAPLPLPVVDTVVLQLPAARGVVLPRPAESAQVTETSYPAHGLERDHRQIASPRAEFAGTFEQALDAMPTALPEPPTLPEPLSLPEPEPLPETQPTKRSVPATENHDGSGQEIPATAHQDDAPPSLPASLRRLATGLRILPNRGILPNRKVRPQAESTRKQASPARRVIPASWQQSTGIQLINPAAAISAGSDEDKLKQAIYYEAAGE